MNFNSFFGRSSGLLLSPGDLLVCTAAIAAAMYAACDLFEDEETTNFILDSFCEQMNHGRHDNDESLLIAPDFIF
ncbi:hypothetical protein [Legionella shakespearei]|uniref:Uncharacterized protein n=1 Tax=Legionella shakespearei DSM 23087 TaxID=1122169 RepID=A0A0W0YKP5_9GAMM|nr:hypothetical protein [Legionella shakespearei]KTD57489.1 hypothetical protein Lsha_2330 [Legionella shakespearei DSM 23087]